MTADAVNVQTARQMSDAAPLIPGGRAQLIMGIEGMTSPRSEKLIESSLNELPSVSANASFASRSLRIEFDRQQCALPEIARRLDHLGFRIRPGGTRAIAEEVRAAEQEAAEGWRHELGVLRFLGAYHKLAMAITGGVLLLIATIVHWMDGPPLVRYVCVGLSFIVAGYYTAIDTFQVLRQFRLDIDVLMFAAAFGAASLGHFEEGAFLLVLFALGGAGEEMAMDRARHAIEALAALAPDTATVVDDDGSERVIPIEQLAVGQRVIVRPFERLAADGTVTQGSSAVDQAPITGESVPVEKTPGDTVFAGTINGGGLLTVAVTKTASETTLAKIVRLVNEAQTSKSPTQLFTDKVEQRYVPLVLLGTVLLIFLPPLLAAASWSTWFYRAMAFLTAASPCALAIGTPAATLSAIGRAARIGVLMKGGVHLENLARVRAVAFDKTGTLTAGRPRVTEVIALHDAFDEQQVLAMAAAVDARDPHPAALAIVEEARLRDIPLVAVDNVSTIAGQGAAAHHEGHKWYVGKLFAETRGHPRVIPLAINGRMLAEIRRGDEAVGVIALADMARGNAAGTIADLHALNVRPCVMLTGDRKAVAEPIARSLGIDAVYAELMPDDKLKLIGELEQQYGPIAMVGDGVNDAPALAAATIGIAMGGAGTDVAIETADVALMGDDLAKLPDAIRLSRFARRVIQQNLVIALGVIAVLAPLAALGHAYLGVAVLFHEGSTVVVVLNALRLLAYRPRQAARA